MGVLLAMMKELNKDKSFYFHFYSLIGDGQLPGLKASQEALEQPSKGVPTGSMAIGKSLWELKWHMKVGPVMSVRRTTFHVQKVMAITKMTFGASP